MEFIEYIKQRLPIEKLRKDLFDLLDSEAEGIQDKHEVLAYEYIQCVDPKLRKVILSRDDHLTIIVIKVVHQVHLGEEVEIHIAVGGYIPPGEGGIYQVEKCCVNLRYDSPRLNLCDAEFYFDEKYDKAAQEEKQAKRQAKLLARQQRDGNSQ